MSIIHVTCWQSHCRCLRLSCNGDLATLSFPYSNPFLKTLKPVCRGPDTGLRCSSLAVSLGMLIHSRKGLSLSFRKSFTNVNSIFQHFPSGSFPPPAFHLWLLYAQLLLTLSQDVKSANEWWLCSKVSLLIIWTVQGPILIHTERSGSKLRY